MKSHRTLMVLILLYVICAGYMAWQLPGFSGSNENLHYEHIALLRQTKRLPDIHTSTRPDERHQPPIYYVSAALLSFPFPDPPLDTAYPRNPHFTGTASGNLNTYVHVNPSTAPVLYVGRTVSIAFGVLTLIATYWGARLTLSYTTSLLVVSLVAFQPNFLHLSATANNDIAVTALCAVLLAYTSDLIIHRRAATRYFWWGILFAAALLAKANAVFLALALLVACLVLWQRHDLQTAIRAGLLSLLGCVPIYAVWLIANRLRSEDTLGLAPSVPLGGMLSLRPADLLLFTPPYLQEIFRSFWLDWSSGLLGYAPEWVYFISQLFLLIGLLGWLRRKTLKPQAASIVMIHLVWILSLSAGYVAVKLLLVRSAGYLVPEGRLLIPALPTLAWFIALGWRCLTSRPVMKWMVWLPPVAAFALLLFLYPVLYPTVGRVRAEDNIPSSANISGLTFNNELKLIGVEPKTLMAGTQNTLQLYWKTLNKPTSDYTVASSLLTFDQPHGWQPIAAHNSLHGQGLSPASTWQEGDIYRDEINLQYNEQLDGPKSVVLKVLLLDEAEQGVQVEQDDAWSDLRFASEMVIRPSTPLQLPSDQLALPAPVQFNNQFELIAIQCCQSLEQPTVELWWHAIDSTDEPLTVFIHVLDANQQVVFQSDAVPMQGESPPRIWEKDDMIRDVHPFSAEIPPDGYLHIGVYNQQTLARLTATQNGEPLPDHIVRIAVAELSPR